MRRRTGTALEDQYTFMIILCSFLLRMRNVSDKHCRESQNTYIVLNNVCLNIVPFMK